MRILLTTLMLTTSLNIHAQSAFQVFVSATVEDNVETMLNDEASKVCSERPARRISQIKTDYKPYRYFITAWANYICVH